MKTNSHLSPLTEQILNVARWAPSGDNAQPWSFEERGEDELLVSIRVAMGNVYEYCDGQPTLISAGTLLENMTIAAASLGKRVHWSYQGVSDGVHQILVRFESIAAESSQPLLGHIHLRSVDRRPYQARPLEAAVKAELEKAAGPEFPLEWFESLSQRRKIAGLTSMATDIRLRIPETFEIHRKIVDWDRTLSPNGIPAQALGLDAMTLKIMRWSMAKQSRNDFMNKMGSPSFAGIQMDILPGIFSAAYFSFRIPARAADPGEAAAQLLRLGQAVQRFWLTATKLGLVLQPCIAPLAFAHYGRTSEAFTVSEPGRRSAAKLAGAVTQMFTNPEQLVFLGRIGWPKPRKVEARSTRLPLKELVRS